MTNTQTISTWKFPKAFWTANIVELFERAAYYGVFIAVTLYLTDVVGFDDVDAAWLSGFFSAGMYFLPPFTGAFADKIGFRKAILLAFSLLTIGYFTLGALPYKAMVVPAFVILMFGGSFIKSIITGTVAKTSDSANRAKAYSIFYGMVNVGAFLGKTIAFPLRLNLGLVSINYFSALMTLLALITVYLFYKNVDMHGEGKKIREVWDGLVRILKRPRLLILILIVTGFWMIQHQMYATMPKYVLRTVGVTASPEWIANVNPAVVMTCVVLITAMMKKVKAVSSMFVGMVLMPFSAICMASSPLLESIAGHQVSIFGLFTAHPVTVMMIVGIMFQGLAECFISPRYLEFFSLQAPKGEEGLYLGFSHLHSFLASVLGFGISGYLLMNYCPDPKTLSPEQMVHAYDNANYIWYYFSAIGFVSAVGLAIYSKVTAKIDAKKR
ncbi:MAG: MFS transporter [Ignavibacteriae bacterium]|nr:MFS transporter [Ignavibacteriota bacterium]